jgi:hypothetical protein
MKLSSKKLGRYVSKYLSISQRARRAHMRGTERMGNFVVISHDDLCNRPRKCAISS